MALMDDFVNHRWEDAKEALRKLDPDFVKRLESEHRLQTLGLDMPQQYSVGGSPRQLLSKKWHRLLEACLELTMQATYLLTAAQYLSAEANSALSSFEAGKRADYHFRSWFIHAKVLAERAADVISKTTEVYIADPKERPMITKSYKAGVYQEIAKRIKQPRDDYVHANRSWARSITEEKLWEGILTLGMTSQRFFDEFRYPDEGGKVKTGEYDLFIPETQRIFDCLGSILQGLELDLISNYSSKYWMGREG